MRLSTVAIMVRVRSVRLCVGWLHHVVVCVDGSVENGENGSDILQNWVVLVGGVEVKGMNVSLHCGVLLLEGFPPDFQCYQSI